MNRRNLLALALSLAITAPTWAQADDAAPVVGAAKIVEALSKDIVLDSQPSNRSRRPPPAARNAAISLQVQFTFGSSELLPHGKRQLDELAMALSDRALLGSSFELAGHTDAVGDAESNLRLSIDRANAVKAYLEQAHGLSPARLQAIGFGFSRLADARNPLAAVNRRVEVRRLGAAPSRPESQTPGGRLVPTPN